MPLQPVALADSYRNISLKQNEQASSFATLTANAVTDTLTFIAGPGISFGTGTSADQVIIFNDFGDENATLSIRAIQIDGFNIDTNVIQLTDSNSDLEIRANGSGQVYVNDNLRIQNDLTMVGDNVNVNSTNNLNFILDDTGYNSVQFPVKFRHTVTRTQQYTGITTNAGFTEVNGSNMTVYDTGTPVVLASVTDVTGISAATTYYIYSASASSFRLATTRAGALAGTGIASSGTYSGGTQTATIHPTNGVGTGIQFVTETANNNLEIGVTLEAVTRDTDNATEDFDFIVRTMTAGATASQVLKINNNTLQIGASNTNTSLTTLGTSDLTIDTNSGLNSGYLKIFDGNNGNIDLSLNGSGTFNIIKGGFTHDWLAVNTNLFFVSATNGSNSYDGRRMNTAFATLAYALTHALSGDTIQLLPGTYTEVFPLTIPQGVTVRGSGIRSTVIKPTAGTNSNDCFLLNGETTVEDITITDMFYNSSANTGYAFRFNTAQLVQVASRSPYILRVTVLNKGSTISASDPYGFVSANAGRGAYIDGSRVTRASLEAAILFNECTFIVPNSRALIMTNGARTEWLNCFTYFADLAVEGLVGILGRGGDGKTFLTLTGVTGTFAVGNTLRYYATNGTTILAFGVIEAVSGNTYQIDGSVANFKTNANRDNKTVTVQNSAQLSTNLPKFGSASLRIVAATQDYISLVSDPDFGYGTGDFTLEFFFKPDALSGTQVLLDQRTDSTDVAISLEMNSTGNIRLYVNGDYRLTSSNACTAQSWNHIALYRISGVTRIAVNGTVTVTTYADTNDYAARPIKLGTVYTATSFATTGYFDEFRIVKGVAKYGTSNFTQPAAAFSGDSSTVLLLHFNGTNGSTVIVDDGITIQDIRSWNGTSTIGNATGITRYDRKEFAAEMRSISSANVYGNQGVKADGADVLIQLMAHNFAYIGTGYDLTNNEATVNQANEVIELNTGKVYYNSVDQSGNFRVGDYFSVDFETGAVQFSNVNFDVSSLTGITFTNGSNTTVIDPTQVSTGNFVISGNTISTISGAITLDPAGTNNLNINASTVIAGDVTVSGNFLRDDITDSGVSYPVSVVHTTSGTPSTGIGTGIQFITETANDNNEIGMSIESVSTDLTSTSEDFNFVLKLMTNGAAPTTKLTVTSAGDATLVGDLQVQGGDLTTNQTTFNLLNTNATTVNMAGIATTVKVSETAGIDTLFSVGPQVPGGSLIPSVTTFDSPVGVSIASAFSFTNVVDGTSGAIGGGSGGGGTGATFNVVKTGTSTNYFGNVTITVNQRGSGYKVGDEIKLIGSDLGGTTPENDMTFVIGGSVTPGNTIYLKSIAQGKVNLGSDVTVGTVDLFAGITTGNVNLATGGASVTNIGGANSIINLGQETGNTILRINARTNGTGIATIESNENSTTARIFNTFVTTGEVLGAATTVKISANATAASTLNFGGSVSDNAILIKSTYNGSVSISSQVTTGIVNLFTNVTSGTVNIANSGASVFNIGGSGALVTIGANSGNSILEIQGNSVLGQVSLQTNTGVQTANVFNSYVTVGNLFGNATTISIGNSGANGTLNIYNDNVVLAGDLEVKGGDLTTNQTTFNLLNATVTTGNVLGVATAVNLAVNASAASTLTFGPTITGNTFEINSVAAGTINLTSDVTTGIVNLYTGVTSGTVNLATGGSGTINVGGAASSLNLGTTAGNSTLTIRGNSTTGTATLATNAATANVMNANATTVNFAGAATSIEIGATTGTTSINHSLTVDGNTTLGDASSDTVTINANSVSVPNTVTYTVNDAANNGPSYPIRLSHTTNGTPANGIGTGIQFITETTDSNLEVGTVIESIVTDGAVNTEDFDFVIKQMIAGQPVEQTFKLNLNTLQIGANNTNTTVTTQGTSNLTLSTNAGTNSGTIVINNGANANIVITPNGTGDVYVDADTLRIGDANLPATFTTNGTSDLTINTNAGTNSGFITIANGIDSNITIEPNGTGDVLINADTVRIGDNNASAFITNQGTASIVLNPSLNLVIGNDTSSATPVSKKFKATDGNGTNIAAANLELEGGLSTGNATGGAITFSTGTIGSTGSSVQFSTTRLSVTPSAAATTLDLVTAMTTANVLNATATTVNFINAATTLNMANSSAAQTVNIANASTATSTYNLATGATEASFYKTLNLATGGLNNSKTDVFIGSDIGTSTASIATVTRSANVATLVTTAAHGFVPGQVVSISCSDSGFTANNITLQSGTTGSTIVYNNIGFNILEATAATGTITFVGSITTINSGIVVGALSTQNLYDTVATTMNFAGAATTVNIGSSTGTLTVRNANVVLDGDLQVKGGDLTTDQTTFNLLNATATTVNFAGDASTLNMGNATAAQTINIGNSSTGASTYNFGTAPSANTLTKTVNLGTGGAAGTTTNVNIGSSVAGTTTINSGTVVGALATQNLYNTTATTINFGGAATTIEIGASTGTTNINHNLDVDGNVNIDGGYLTVSTTAFNLANTTATILNLAGEATAVNIGVNASTASTLTFGPTITGNTFEINGTPAGNITLSSDVTTGTVNLYTSITSGTVNLATGGASTTNIGGAASQLNIGTTSGNSIIELRGNSTSGAVTLRTSTGVVTANVFNTEVTTGNLFGLGETVNIAIAATAASTLTFGGANITANTFKINSRTDGSGTINLTTDVTTGVVNLYTGVTSGTVNIATGGASTTNIGGSTGVVNIGITTGNSILEIRGSNSNGTSTIRSNAGATRADVYNTVVTTGNLFGIATAVNLAVDASTASTLTFGPAITDNTFKINSIAAGTINLTSDITTGIVNLYTGVTTGTVNLATGGANTTNIGGAAASVNIGTTTGNSTLTIRGNATTGTATLATNAATADIMNANATTVNLAGAGTAINIGASTGTVTISNPVITQSNATSVTFNMNGPTPTIASNSTSGTATVFNTNITTLNLAGASTTLNIGNATAEQTMNLGIASTGASTYNLGTGTTASATTKTINLGTGGAAGSTTNVNIGSNSGGTTTMNSGTVVGSNTIQNLFNNATTVNAFLDATTIETGNTTGTYLINNPTVRGSQATVNLWNTVTTTINAFGAAGTINMGLAGNNGTFTLNNDNVVLNGDLQVKGGDLTTNQITFNLLNNTVKTLNFVSVADTINVGNLGTQINATGTLNQGSINVSRNLVVNGDITAKNDVIIWGSLNLTGDINGGPLRTDDIQIVGNRIETTSSNSDLEINTQGAGNIVLLADTKQVGTIQVNNQLTLNTFTISTVSGNQDLTLSAHGTGRINLESIAVSGTNIDTTDSSNISITPSVVFQSDITAENGIHTQGHIVPNSPMTYSIGEFNNRFSKGHFGQLTLITDLEVEYGGTGQSSFTTRGILYGNADSAIQVTAASNPGNNQTTSYGVLTTDVNNVPIWTDVIDGGSY